MGLSELSGKIAWTPSSLDDVHQVAEILRVGLRLGGLGGDHGPDHVDAVAVREVAERVVVGDQLAVGGGNAVDAVGDSGVQVLQLRLVAAALASNEASPAGSTSESWAAI